jgi:hypothetical protein
MNRDTTRVRFCRLFYEIIETKREKAQPNAFIIQYLSVCLNVATILPKLDAIDQDDRDLEKATKPRLDFRLGCVNLLVSFWIFQLAKQCISLVTFSRIGVKLGKSEPLRTKYLGWEDAQSRIQMARLSRPLTLGLYGPMSRPSDLHRLGLSYRC